MTANAKTIEVSTNFVARCRCVLEYVEMTSKFVPEGIYLQQMNNVGALYKMNPEDKKPTTVRELFQAMFEEDPVYQEHARVLQYKPRKFKKEMSDAEKLKSGLYKKCVRCDKVISKGYYSKHIHNNSCVSVLKTKKLSKETNKLDTTRLSKFITSINAYKHEAIRRKITMYQVAIEYYRSLEDLEYVALIKQKLNAIAVLA